MEFLAAVKGAPLTRIACANCQQARQEPRGRARSNHGPELKSALWALKRGELIVMPEVVPADPTNPSCPECGKVCATRADVAIHCQAHDQAHAAEREQAVEETR